MMKVTFLTGEYPPMQGGIADHTAHLAAHLARLDIEPSVLISRRWRETADSPPASPPVYADLPDWGWRCWPGVGLFLRQHQPDILHIQYQAAAFDLGGWINWLPWYLQRRRRSARIVVTFHDLRSPYIFPKAGRFRWHSMLALARHSQAVICTNREDLHALTETLPPAKSRLVHIPLGGNIQPRPPADFDRSAWRKQYGLADDSLLLAYFGFLNESKGGEELIEALAHLRGQGVAAHLLLIGGEVGHADPTNRTYAGRVQALIEQYGLAPFVHRTGYVEPPQVSASLLAADVVVMPYRDGLSFRRTTLIAALQHGRPVVSTTPADPAFIPEVRPGENMLLAPPGDAPALAQAITRLADDSALRDKLAAGAARLGDLFRWDRIAADTASLYRDLIPAPESPPP